MDRMSDYSRYSSLYSDFRFQIDQKKKWNDNIEICTPFGVITY